MKGQTKNHTYAVGIGFFVVYPFWQRGKLRHKASRGKRIYNREVSLDIHPCASDIAPPNWKDNPMEGGYGFGKFSEFLIVGQIRFGRLLSDKSFGEPPVGVEGSCFTCYRVRTKKSRLGDFYEQHL